MQGRYLVVDVRHRRNLTPARFPGSREPAALDDEARSHVARPTRSLASGGALGAMDAVSPILPQYLRNAPGSPAAAEETGVLCWRGGREVERSLALAPVGVHAVQVRGYRSLSTLRAESLKTGRRLPVFTLHGPTGSARASCCVLAWNGRRGQTPSSPGWWI